MNDDHNPSEGEDHPSDDEALHEQLLELVDRACQHPRGSSQRNRYLNRLIRDIKRSGKLWKENTLYYEEALHKTWIYLSRNLCEAITAKQPYDRTKSRITTWLDSYLQHRLKDERLAEQKAKQKIISRPPLSLDDDQNFDLTEHLPARTDLSFYMEEILEWIETDPTGELKSNHLPRKRDITCQIVLQRKWSSGQSMEQLAAEFGCAPSTLYNFFKSHCVPLLQKFCEDQGYQLTISGVYDNE